MTQATTLLTAAKNIRTELKQHYPSIMFRVRSRTYSGGDSISVTWRGGPTAEDVAKLTSNYEQGYFDGTTDSYVRDESPERLEFHRLHGSTKYVILQRLRVAA